MEKLWFSLYDHEAYTGAEEAFISLENYPGIEALQSNYHIIFEELKLFLSENKMEVQFNHSMVEVPKSWKVRSLRVWGVEMYEIQKHFPKTMHLLEAVPNVVNIGFNLLEPHSKIKPHSGDTNAIYRCHLGLQIPSNQTQAAMLVNKQQQYWLDGKVLSFIDAFEHEAWNNSDEQRIILLFDILKPEFVEKKNIICATVLGSFYLQQIGNYWAGIYTVKRKMFRYMLFPFIRLIGIVIPIRNFFKKKL